MSKWYLVKENWGVISDISSKYQMEYIGLGGDTRPHDSVIDNSCLDNQLQKSMSHTEIEYNGIITDVYASTELDMIEKYFNSLTTKIKKLIFIELQLAFDGFDANVDGFDFGNPTGGYSVIETEIILKDSKIAIDTYLNKFGLFKSIDLMHNFLSSLEGAVQRGECEALDDYVPVAVRRLG